MAVVPFPHPARPNKSTFRIGDIIVTAGPRTTGHMVRAFLNQAESNAIERAARYAAMGLTVTFESPSGEVYWQETPPGVSITKPGAPALA